MTVGWLVALVAVGAGIIWHQSAARTAAARPTSSARRCWPSFRQDRRIYLLRFLAGGVLVVVGVIGLLVVYSPVARRHLVGPVAGDRVRAGGAGRGRPGGGAGAVAHADRAALRAGGPHPRAGARRAGRDGARPGAAHAGADPAQRGRPDGGAAARPRPGALACATGSTSRPARRPSISPRRWSRRRRRSRTPTASRWRRWWSATALVDDKVGRARRRGARGDGQRGPPRQGQDRLAVRRGRAEPAQRLRPRPRGRLRPRRTVEDHAARRPWLDHRPDVTGTAAQAEIRSDAGEGTEVRLHACR